MKTKFLFTISVFCMLCIAALAQDKQVLEPTGHWPDKSDICEPIGDFGFSFDERIAAVDGAEGMIVCDGEVVARGPIRIDNNALGGVSWAIISFAQDGEELLLPNDYKECRAVIPAGTLWLEDNPDVKNEELVANFRVPTYLEYGNVYCPEFLSRVSSIMVDFETDVKVINPENAYAELYRNEVLVRYLPVSERRSNTVSLDFIQWLAVLVSLEYGANYKVVIPVGIICAAERTDIVNYEFYFRFTGLGHTEMLRHEKCSLDGVTGLGEIGKVSLYYDVSLFLTPGAKLQLYDGVTLVKEVEASLDGEDEWSQNILTADFGGVSTAGHESLTIIVPEATVAQDGDDVIVNEREEIPIDIASGISGVEADGGVKVACRGGVLTVSDARQGAGITVCSVDGKVVSRCTAGGASVDIPLPGDGIYIVNVDGKTYKLASQAMKN